MSHTITFRSAAATSLLLVATLVGCAGTAPSGGETALDPAGLGSEETAEALDALYQTAREAGQNEVVVHGPAAAESAPLWEAFQERFPDITVTARSVAPPETAEKLRAEASSGNAAIGLVFTGDNPAAQLSRDGFCQTLDLVTAEGLDAEWLPMGGTILRPSISVFGLVYNSELVDEADVPRSWDDLLDPMWKGKIASGDPAGGGIAGYVFAEMLYEKNVEALGMEYIEKLKAQDLQVVSAEPEIASAVASGRFPIGINVWQGFADSVIAKGVPLEFLFPFETNNVTTSDATCLPTSTPTPEASELLLNWLLTPEAQKVTAEAGGYSTMPNAMTPEGMPPFADVDLLEDPPFEEVAYTIGPLREQVIELFR